MEGEEKRKAVAGGEGGGRPAEVVVANPRDIRSSEFALRLLALGATVAAAMVMGLAKETQVVPTSPSLGFTPIPQSLHAKATDSSALVYFVAIHAIAGGYSALSLLATLARVAGQQHMQLSMVVLDVLAVALLFSADGAAAAIAVLSAEGNPHLRCRKICFLFQEFCRSLAASLVISMLGSVIFILLILLSIRRLHLKPR